MIVNALTIFHVMLSLIGIGSDVVAIALIIASLSIYRYYSKGIWRRTYGITAVMALYFNVFVLVVQLFRRVPALSVVASRNRLFR